MASLITRKHQSSASLAFVRGLCRRPVNSLHKWPVTRKIFSFDDVIMKHNTHDQTLSQSPCTALTADKCLPFNIFIQISLKVASKGPVDNKTPIVQVITWRQLDDYPLPVDISTVDFTDRIFIPPCARAGIPRHRIDNVWPANSNGRAFGMNP